MKDSTKSTNPSTIRVRGALPRASRTTSSAAKLPTIKSDIVISIKPRFMDMIVQRSKDHEYRSYIIPAEVKRMWLYVSSPDQTLRYIATISNAKRPGDIADENGAGNADFNAGLKPGEFAYEVKELYRIRDPLPLQAMKERYGLSFPQRFSYAPEKLVLNVALDEQERLF